MISKKIKHQINLVTQDLNLQKKIYHPTYFWKNVSLKFINIFKKRGLKNFRRYNLSTNYFVPLYNFFKEDKLDIFRKN